MPIPSASASKQGSLETSGREFKKMEVGKCQPLPEEPAPLTAPVLASHPAHLLLVVGASAPPLLPAAPRPCAGMGDELGAADPRRTRDGFEQPRPAAATALRGDVSLARSWQAGHAVHAGCAAPDTACLPQTPGPALLARYGLSTN